MAGRSAAKWTAIALATAGLLVVSVFAGARLHDGPVGIIPGGPLEAGTPVSDTITDWSFARDVQEIEMQLEGDDTSRTSWIVVDDGMAIIPCTLSWPPGKTWHRRAAPKRDAVLRIDDRLYAVTLEKMDDASRNAHLAKVLGTLHTKYNMPGRDGNAPSSPRTTAQFLSRIVHHLDAFGDLWLFAVQPRQVDEPRAL